MPNLITVDLVVVSYMEIATFSYPNFDVAVVKAPTVADATRVRKA